MCPTSPQGLIFLRVWLHLRTHSAKSSKADLKSPIALPHRFPLKIYQQNVSIDFFWVSSIPSEVKSFQKGYCKFYKHVKLCWLKARRISVSGPGTVQGRKLHIFESRWEKSHNKPHLFYNFLIYWVCSLLSFCLMLQESARHLLSPPVKRFILCLGQSLKYQRVRA